MRPANPCRTHQSHLSAGSQPRVREPARQTRTEDPSRARVPAPALAPRASGRSQRPARPSGSGQPARVPAPALRPSGRGPARPQPRGEKAGGPLLGPRPQPRPSRQQSPAGSWAAPPPPHRPHPPGRPWPGREPWRAPSAWPQRRRRSSGEGCCRWPCGPSACPCPVPRRGIVRGVALPKLPLGRGAHLLRELARDGDGDGVAGPHGLEVLLVLVLVRNPDIHHSTRGILVRDLKARRQVALPDRAGFGVAHRLHRLRQGQRKVSGRGSQRAAGAVCQRSPRSGPGTTRPW